MIQVYKEAERQKSNIEKNKANTMRNILPRVKDCEVDSSSSSMSMYSLYFGEEGSKFQSNWIPTMVIHNAQLMMHVE